MLISGTSTFAADRQSVWQALVDPAVLVRTIPGCRRLEALGDDAYAMTVAAGVGSIRGVYDGHVRLTDRQEPDSFRLRAQGSGAPGTINADVLVTLRDADDGGTTLTYEADASIGGTIGGVGQRMLVGVSKKTAAEFFSNVDSLLAVSHGAGSGGRTEGAGATVGPSPADLPDGAEAAKPSGRARSSHGLPPNPSTAAPTPSVRSASSTAAGTVYTSPEKRQGTEGSAFARGVAVGTVASLVGALVGAWISRRGRG